MSPVAKVFQQILDDHSTKNCMAVFDLDSTLYNVSFRTQKIIEDFIFQSKAQNKFLSELPHLSLVRVEMQDWGLRDSFSRVDFEPSPELFRELRNYWNKHFFSSEYLVHDMPYRGSVDYVNRLATHGVQIVYLTGRDAPNMHTGTVASLKQWKFPLESLEHLILKNSKGEIEDEDYKSLKINDLKKQNKKIWFFENEPVIINKVLKHHDDIDVIWVNTTHSRRERPPADIITIEDEWSTG